jgi:hypothetical protein
MYQIARLSNQVSFTRCAVLNDDNSLEIDPKVLDPFLNCFLDSRVKAF